MLLARATRTSLDAIAERADVTKLTQAQVPDAEAHASEIMLLLEGYDGLILIHGQRRYIDAAASAAKRLAAKPLQHAA